MSIGRSLCQKHNNAAPKRRTRSQRDGRESWREIFITCRAPLYFHPTTRRRRLATQRKHRLCSFVCGFAPRMHRVLRARSNEARTQNAPQPKVAVPHEIEFATRRRIFAARSLSQLGART